MHVILGVSAVKYLDEVFHNMQHSPLSAHYFELPVTKTRHSLGAWLFTVMSSKCNVTKTGEKGCHDVISNIVGLILDLCDKDKDPITAVRVSGDPPVREVKTINVAFGIPLYAICEAFNTVVTDQVVSEPETIDSDMEGVSITDMNSYMKGRVEHKIKLTRQALHTQRQLEATGRAIVKRKRVESEAAAVTAVTATVTAIARNANVVLTSTEHTEIDRDGESQTFITVSEMAHDDADYSAADEAAPEVTAAVPMSAADFGKALLTIGEELENSVEEYNELTRLPCLNQSFQNLKRLIQTWTQS